MKGKGKRYLLNGSLFSPAITLVHATTMANLDLATFHENTYITFIQTHRIIPTHPGYSQEQPIIFHAKDIHHSLIKVLE